MRVPSGCIGQSREGVLGNLVWTSLPTGIDTWGATLMRPRSRAPSRTGGLDARAPPQRGLRIPRLGSSRLGRGEPRETLALVTPHELGARRARKPSFVGTDVARSLALNQEGPAPRTRRRRVVPRRSYRQGT